MKRYFDEKYGVWVTVGEPAVAYGAARADVISPRGVRGWGAAKSAAAVLSGSRKHGKRRSGK